MEHGTMRCYRCNAPMASGGYIHCSTCRTEDALRRQTSELQRNSTVNQQMAATLVQAIISAQRFQSRPQQSNSVPTVNYGYTPARPELTEEQKRIEHEKTLKRIAIIEREARMITIFAVSVLTLYASAIGLVIYYVWKFFASL